MARPNHGGGSGSPAPQPKASAKEDRGPCMVRPKYGFAVSSAGEVWKTIILHPG